MKRYRTFTVIGLMAALLLSSCSQEELGEQGMALPEGEYPLQIGNVTLTAEVSEQPWTRVSESSADGMSSVWEGDEQIGVQIGRGQPGIYTVQADGSVVAENPVYWTSTALTYVNAWYPTNETVDLSNQSNGLAYVLNAIQDYVTYDQPVTLNFTHQLAKVRVVLSGTQASQVNAVEVYGITACAHLRGMTVNYDASNTGWIKMKKQTFDNDTECWEANVVPGEVISQIKVNNTETTLTASLTPKVAALNTINLTVGEKITDIKDNTTINDNGYYRVSGTFNQQINITGGNPTIYLENANISVNNGNAISITGDANATIHITGNNTVQNTSYTINGAGIYVEAGSTVTIEGTNRNTDVLTAIAANDAAGIGGNFNGQDCGNIHIHNVTVVAKGDQSIALSPGIGSTGNNNCGQIIIDNATVHAYGQGISGTAVCPAIGPGFSSGLEYGNLPMVTIRNESEVHAHRGGGNADYIGYPYKYSVATGAASTVNLGQGGICTSSTVYCYTGNTLDKTVVYDASGNATQQ